MRARLVALTLALLLAPGCEDKPVPKESPGVVAIGLEPIPAPEGLLAEIAIGTPDATWTRARAAAGGSALLLPNGFAAAALSVLELPITLAGEIDGSVPAVGALVRVEGSEPAIAIAIHVRAGDRLVDMLTKGDAARFTASSDPATKIALLTARTPTGSPPRVALGVLGHYLVAARSVANLQAAGPYAARTLATRPAPKEDVVIEVPERALGGPIADGARALVARWREGGGSEALARSSGLEALLEALPDLARARVTAKLDGAALHVVAALEPKPGGGAATKLAAEMAVGDAKPLLDLPADAAGAALFRSSPSGAKSIFEGDAALVATLLGKDASREDRAAVEAALRAVYDARGEWIAFGAEVASTGPTAFARTPVRDAGKVSKAIDQLLELGKLASVKDELGKRRLEVTSSKTAIENLPGDVRRVRFTKIDEAPSKKDNKDKDKSAVDPKAKSAEPPDARNAVDLLYLVGKDTLFASAGFDPKETLKKVVTADKTLASVAPVRAALEGLGDASAATLFFDAHRLAVGAAPDEPAPVAAALGKSGGSLTVRVDASVAALQELARRRRSF